MSPPNRFSCRHQFYTGDGIQRRTADIHKHRHDFEKLLLKYKHFINQTGKQYGSGTRGLTALTRLDR